MEIKLLTPKTISIKCCEQEMNEENVFTTIQCPKHQLINFGPTSQLNYKLQQLIACSSADKSTVDFPKRERCVRYHKFLVFLVDN